jgi:hypothetical protein
MKTLTKPRSTPGRNSNGKNRLIGRNSNGKNQLIDLTDAEPAAETSSKTTAKTKTTKIALIQMKKRIIQFRVVGETPLIVHQFSEKERQRMLDDQMGKVNPVKREPKNPLQCFRDSLYRLPEGRGFGIPARAFKAAAVTVSNDINLMKTQMKRCVRVLGPDLNPLDVDALIPIEADPITTPITAEDKQYWKEMEFERKHGASMRQDIVRLANGSADIRFRAWFPKWACILNVTYNEGMMNEEQILALFEAAGFGSGVMEWRPSAPHSDSGQYGSFTIDLTYQMKQIHPDALLKR